MLRTLRNRLLLVNMIALSIMMIAAFVIIYVVTYTATMSEIEQKVQRAPIIPVQNETDADDVASSDTGASQGQSILPVGYEPSFSLILNTDGEIERLITVLSIPYNSYFSAAESVEAAGVRSGQINFENTIMEADGVQLARTGHTVLTTIHSNSCESTYSRMRTLCKRKYDMDDGVLMDLVTEAFPIVVFTKQLENKQRRLMEIMECEILPDGHRRFRPLFRYEIIENRMSGEEFIIKGVHRKINPISAGLAERFLENGMPKEMLDAITKGGKQTC